MQQETIESGGKRTQPGSKGNQSHMHKHHL